MTMKLRSCALLALACAIAACGSEKSGTSTASGSNEVLKGTISDDMIAYDTLRSQPPAAKIVTESTGAPGDASDRTRPGGEATEAAAGDEAAGKPANSGPANGAAAPASEND